MTFEIFMLQFMHSNKNVLGFPFLLELCNLAVVLHGFLLQPDWMVLDLLKYIECGEVGIIL